MTKTKDLPLHIKSIPTVQDLIYYLNTIEDKTLPIVLGYTGDDEIHSLDLKDVSGITNLVAWQWDFTTSRKGELVTMIQLAIEEDDTKPEYVKGYDYLISKCLHLTNTNR